MSFPHQAIASVIHAVKTRTPLPTGDVLVTQAELEALEDHYPADQRWVTGDGGYRFGRTAMGTTFRVEGE